MTNEERQGQVRTAAERQTESQEYDRTGPRAPCPRCGIEIVCSVAGLKSGGQCSGCGYREPCC